MTFDSILSPKPRPLLDSHAVQDRRYTRTRLSPLTSLHSCTLEGGRSSTFILTVSCQREQRFSKELWTQCRSSSHYTSTAIPRIDCDHLPKRLCRV